MLVAPLYYRLLLRTGPLDWRLADALVASVLAVLAPTPVGPDDV